MMFYLIMSSIYNCQDHGDFKKQTYFFFFFPFFFLTQGLTYTSSKHRDATDLTLSPKHSLIFKAGGL